MLNIQRSRYLAQLEMEFQVSRKENNMNSRKMILCRAMCHGLEYGLTPKGSYVRSLVPSIVTFRESKTFAGDFSGS